MSDNIVRLEGTITVKVLVVIDEDLYERWNAGESGAQNEVDQLLSEAGRDALVMEDGDNAEIKRAILCENDGYLGTDIAVLKTF